MASVRLAIAAIGLFVCASGVLGDEPPKDVVLARRPLLERRRAAEAAGDLVAVATINAELSGEAIERALRVHDAWMPRRSEKTGLFPESPTRPEWNYRNTGADFFCYQFAIALQTGAASVPLLRETLARERALNPAGVTGGFCTAIDSATGQKLEQAPRERLFATCEYLKDGLTPLYERYADPVVLSRMIEIGDAIIAGSEVQSRYGKIPSRDSEINGNVLQSFSRLGFFAGPTEGKRFHELSGRLADAAIMQMLASAGGVPIHFYDYSTDRFPSGVLKLRDHGNETAVGLSEAFATAVALKDATKGEPIWAERADRWAEPLARMYEIILDRGVDSRGLIASVLDGGGGKGGKTGVEKPAEPLHIVSDEPCDNWGYLLSGALLYVEAAQRHGKVPRERLDAILAGVDRVAIAVTKTDGLRWEQDNPDGFADTIESALYVASRRPTVRTKLLEWADDQIGYLFGYQHADGFVLGNYLDGNFIRTSMQYADMRSGGFHLVPHTPGAAVGLAAATGGDPVIVVLAGPAGCHAMLTPDFDRHHSMLHLPWDWPRINAWPEWGGVEVKGSAVPKGVRIDLVPNEKKTLHISDTGAAAWRLP